MHALNASDIESNICCIHTNVVRAPCNNGDVQIFSVRA